MDGQQQERTGEASTIAGTRFALQNLLHMLEPGVALQFDTFTDLIKRATTNGKATHRFRDTTITLERTAD